jgi:hypothetical protein
MKRMRRLTPTFACAVATLIWTCNPAQAQTMGNLVRTQTFKLELANNSTAWVRGAVTVYWLKPRHPGRRVAGRDGSGGRCRDSAESEPRYLRGESGSEQPFRFQTQSRTTRCRRDRH